jgi:membrane fusion protein, multidrug efflux system
MRKAVFFIAASILLAACAKKEPAPDPVRAVRTMTVTAGSASGSHEYAAEVRAKTESRLGFRVGGKVVRRNVNLGDSVKAGQVLAQLDAQDLRLGQEAAQAQLRSAQVSLDQAAADFKRFRDLREQGFISAAELERRQSSLEAAQEQWAQARAQAGVQGNQAGYATLVADASGVITAVEADPGTVVAPGTPVLRLAHDGPRDVVFSVPEDRIAALRSLAGRPGAVKVKVWGEGDRAMAATVREVAAAADPATRTFLVKADVGAAPVRLGQTATAVIDTPKVQGITKVPLAAVMQQQGKTAVWLVDPSTMTVHVQPIEVAGAEGNAIVVAAGLQPGQIVVTAGVHVLTPGLKVKFYGEPAAALASVQR